MIWSSKRAIAASLPFFLAHACQPLSEIPDDVCGNRVVEPERNEDCDEVSDRCYPPTDPRACRFRCLVTADCPAGHACGLDEICREPRGALALAHEARDETDGLEVADFDADGQLDLLRSSSDHVQIHHLSAALTPELTQTIRRNGGDRVMAIDLDGAAGADLIVPTPIGLGGANGLGIYLSETTRSFTPASFASFPIPAAAIRGAVLDGIFPPSEKEIVALVQLIPELGGGRALFGISTRSSDQQLAAPPLPHPNDVVGLASLRIDPFSCEWLVVAQRGATELQLIKPCGPEALYGWNAFGMGAQPVSMAIAIADATIIDPMLGPEKLEALEPLAAIEAVFTGDFDGNGLEDVAVTVLSADPPRIALHVSYQTRLHATLPGRGFHSQPPPAELPELPDTDLFAADNSTSELPIDGFGSCAKKMGLPLAVADVNNDQKLDVAFTHATAVSVIGPFYDIRCDHRWRRGAAGDLDGSGTPDFVGVRADESGLATGVEVLLSASDGVLTRYLVATESPVDFLAVHNFDGDQADDFVYVERGYEGQAQPFHAVFGEATGGFGAARSLGSLPNVVQLAVGRSNGFDAAAEVITVSALGGIAADGSLVDAAGAVMIGSSAREILAPYTVSFEVIENTTELDVERIVTKTVQVARGDFGGPALALVTIDRREEGADDENGEDADEKVRLILVPFASETLLGAPLAGVYDPRTDNRGLDCRECAIVAIDAGDGDRLWSFGTEGVAHYALNAEGFGLAEPLAIPSDWGESGCGEAPAIDFGEGVVRERDPPIVSDVDADGHADVLVFAKRCEKGERIRDVIVFFSDGAGDLSFDRTLRIAGTASCRIESAAFMQLDAGPSLELVVAVDAAPGTASCERRLLKFETARGAISSIADGLSLAEDGKLPIPHRPEVMVAGDLDGDGIQDLAVGGFGGFALYRGLAVRP